MVSANSSRRYAEYRRQLRQRRQERQWRRCRAARRCHRLPRPDRSADCCGNFCGCSRGHGWAIGFALAHADDLHAAASGAAAGDEAGDRQRADRRAASCLVDQRAGPADRSLSSAVSGRRRGRRRLAAGHGHSSERPLVRHQGGQQAASRDSPPRVRPCRAAAAAPRVSAQVGRRGEPAARRRRRHRRAGLQHALQPLAGHHPADRQPGRAGLGRLADDARRPAAAAGRVRHASHLDQPHPAAVPRHPHAAARHRRPDDRSLRRHARRPHLRPGAERNRPLRHRQPPDGPPAAVRLVVDAGRRARSGRC